MGSVQQQPTSPSLPRQPQPGAAGAAVGGGAASGNQTGAEWGQQQQQRCRGVVVACLRELGALYGGQALYAEAEEHLSRAVALDDACAEAHFQLATALAYRSVPRHAMPPRSLARSPGCAGRLSVHGPQCRDEHESADSHYARAQELRAAGVPPPQPDEQARLLGIELLLEAEEAAQFFGELAAHKEAATCELPQLPGVLWSTDMRLASERE